LKNTLEYGPSLFPKKKQTNLKKLLVFKQEKNVSVANHNQALRIYKYNGPLDMITAKTFPRLNL